MVKRWNSTLNRNKPLKAKKGLERHTPLKARKGQGWNSSLQPVSPMQQAWTELWNEITTEKCYEIGFVCLWCGGPGQRNEPERFDYLDGHHTRKPRRSHNEKRFCYPAHRAVCHREIDDNNVDVELYPNREAWLRSKNNE